MPRLYKVFRKYHRALLCYQDAGAVSWTVEIDFPIQARAKAVARAHALNVGADPQALGLSVSAVAEIRRLQVERWQKIQEKNKQGHQHGLFDEEPAPPEDPPEDAYEAWVSEQQAPRDPDIPF